MKSVRSRWAGILLGMLLIGRAASAWAEPLTIDGLIEPHRVINIGSGVPGVLATVEVDRGDLIIQGRVLATLQSGVETATMELARARTEMDAAVRIAEERVAFSRRQKERIDQLYSQKALPFNEMDQAQTDLRLAELNLQEAMENKRLASLEFARARAVVERLSITSPVHGVVVQRFLSPGEYVENQPILELAQIDPLNVEVILPADQLGRIALGMQARVRPEAAFEGALTARVTVVDRVVDAASGTFGVRLEMPNPRYRLPPGLKCTVTFDGD